MRRKKISCEKEIRSISVKKPIRRHCWEDEEWEEEMAEEG
jgi:hypothetical protein